ncbi:EAL domain-containing protein [Paraglaciecola marina]|uniref:bifunctional diguanylate cyclase/phosphodiesterase n=1 Tax=Paraglaciecola marina TaxID=2500157 RepID=UPI0010604AFE|nr:EAL domain-containing protein [Paraglaciecola marina]
MFFKSIKSATTAYLTCVLILISCIALFISIQENRRISLDSISNELNLVSTYLGEELTSRSVVLLPSSQQAQVFNALDKFKSVSYAAVYDSNWQLQQSYIKEAFKATSLEPQNYVATPILNQQPVSNFINDTLVVITAIGAELSTNNYLVVVSDVSKVLEENTTSLLKHTLPLFVVLLSLCAAFGYALQGKLLNPLILISKFAKEVEVRKDYSIEIKTLGKQELVELGGSINSMLRTINTEYSRSRELSQTLKEHQKNAERWANFDRLTGFPNRQFFMQTLRIELARTMRNSQDLVLIYFDLDGISKVYDELGQETGDQLLIKVCERAKGLLREGDLIARLDDSEFLILLHNQPTDTMLANIVERLIKDFNVPFSLNNLVVEVTINIGIAKASDSNFNLSEFIENADIAMYRSKMLGINTHTMYLPDMKKDNKRSVLIAATIEEAIQNKEFTVNYQSRVSVDERVMGYDVSVHWDSKTLGFIPESEFNPIAVNNGKSCAISMWVVETVCRDLATITELNNAQLVISINLCCVNNEHTNVLGFIKNTFSTYQVNPANIEFTLPELVYLESYDLASVFLNKLRGIGAGVALSNFGCGYSGLGYLHQSDLTTIRIDKHFIDNLMLSKRPTLVVKTILKIATQLGVQVCADGVETREQVDFLVSVGCHQMQGFLFSKPSALAQLIYAEN